ncbi:nitrile hydratase accessory protein [Actinomycetospora endophytica]|uniref:Nitrile hydratase accessory protein n=1 Tax=Actinomycetospora endophytica TaxID=2291215 RepID=A0ABS8P825_9PSEU|nr:nitrile hydratase accessory protein [Actinomycetospora endophytica]MCD2194391.1 nitrile hydratase accessory protein [Actinomycetospora endophytica]
MSTTLDMDGPAAPPRSNGELVFAAPWESRAFGLVVTLVDSGRFTYEEFRSRLIVRVGEVEARPYWEAWLAALEDMLSGTVDEATVTARAAALREVDDHGDDHEH